MRRHCSPTVKRWILLWLDIYTKLSKTVLRLLKFSSLAERILSRDSVTSSPDSVHSSRLNQRSRFGKLCRISLFLSKRLPAVRFLRDALLPPLYSTQRISIVAGLAPSDVKNPLVRSQQKARRHQQRLREWLPLEKNNAAVKAAPNRIRIMHDISIAF